MQSSDALKQAGYQEVMYVTDGVKIGKHNPCHDGAAQFDCRSSWLLLCRAPDGCAAVGCCFVCHCTPSLLPE
jgi:hypothetical protein